MRTLTIQILAVLLIFGCSRAPKGDVELPYGLMRNGDLAFRCGGGVFSRVVTAAGDGGVYSHVGVLVKNGGKWMVVHAVPGEKEFNGDFARVKVESAGKFFAPDRAFRGCLVHTGLADSLRLAALCSTALRYARDSVRFDGFYDLADSAEVYCTEMVWRLYRRAGIDLSEGRRRHVNMIGLHSECILPEHLLKYTGNDIYFIF